jgi:hypothetical protein
LQVKENQAVLKLNLLNEERLAVKQIDPFGENTKFARNKWNILEISKEIGRNLNINNIT